MKLLLLILGVCVTVHSQQRRVGKFTEVYAWKQITYNIDGNIVSEDRASAEGLQRRKRQSYNSHSNNDDIYFNDAPEAERDWNMRYPDDNSNGQAPNLNTDNGNPTGSSKLDEKSDSFFIQYNNVPMGAEKVGDQLFVALPRRRYGIPATLNYIDLSDTSRSPALKPYPSLRESRGLVSVYRTRADSCGRLWAVDTGLMELPETPRQIQQPSIVVFDLNTDRQILRYQLKESDVPANNTPTGHRFQWSDGIFSIALAPGSGCRSAYFHPLISTQEFSVNTCTLNNRTAHTDSEYWTRYEILGERGPNSQSTMHDIHPSGVLFYADIGSDGVACWNTNRALGPQTFHLLASDVQRLSYPADLHVTDDEVWVITNTLPRFGYSRLNPNDYNFYVYKANVQELVAGTVCEGSSNNPPRRTYNRQRPTSNQNRAPPRSTYQSSTYNRYN